MARQQAVAEINAFVKGLVTEASPLTFPENASIDEVNLILNRDGSRNRRFGMDLEDGFLLRDTGQSPASSFAINSFAWKAPGGFEDQEFCVVQTGTFITFFNSSTLPISPNMLLQDTLAIPPTTKVAFTAVDGILVVADGSGNIISFDYNGSTISRSSGRLKIRDQFGVEDFASGVNLLEGNGIATRPNTRTDNHVYNLRNQTFAVPRYYDNGEALRDPVTTFFEQWGVLQANSDNLTVFLYADANDSDNRNIRRYFGEDNYSNPLGTNRAPMGYFIIDAMDRGASRMQALGFLHQQYSQLNFPITSLPADRTPGGATFVATYGGRVFYSGFSSQIIDGDSQSPRMGSYVLFSRLVQSTSDIFKCYQEGDPTSSETPDLVDTDGGFIRLDGAFNIKYMVNVGDALMVIAENGVWKITGGSGYGFKATDYLTSKVTEHGSISPNSVVLVDNTFMYWSDDGIYHVNQNQYGDWVATNISNTVIQTYYDQIPYLAKRACQGMYDSYQRRVRWLYYNSVSDTEDARELILDVNLGAFYPSKMGTLDGTYPRPLAMVKVPPFESVRASSPVTSSNGSRVISSNGSGVVTTEAVVDSALSEIYYITATGVAAGTIRFTFSLYKDTTFYDWKVVNGIGVDSAAYLVTGWTGMGDFQRQKQVTYLTTYAQKTETGFDANFNPINPSSIKVQSQWNWTNSAASNKWSEPFQVYRHKRLWIPSNVSEEFNDGEYVVTTKNKLRGRGKVLSLKFSTEPGKDFHLLGWSFIGAVNGAP